ncbi:MAG TPA: hypothetical protein VN577_03340 [Terriglobales bacterium]|nr:hypothetical protein [Terriglobales bacterium]
MFTGRVPLLSFLFLTTLLLVSCGGNGNSSTGSNGSPVSPGTSNPGGSNDGGSDSGGTAVSAPEHTAFLYGTSGETILGAKVDGAGRITAVDMPFDSVSGNTGWFPGTGGLISSIATDPQGRFVYALSVQTSSFGMPIGQNGLSEFTVDRNSGALTLVGSPYSLQNRGGEIAITADGLKLLLLVNDTMSVYSIDQSSGALNLLKTNAALSGHLRTSWTGQFAFVDTDSGPLVAYRIEADGSTSEVSRVEVQNRGQLFVSYSGKYVYSSGDEGITVVAVDSNGYLNITQPNFSGFHMVATTRDDRFAYLGTSDFQTGTGRMLAFTLDPASGAIENTVGAPVLWQAGAFPFEVLTDFDGKNLYVASAGSDFQTFTVNSDGSLGTPDVENFRVQFFEMLP